MKLHKLVVLFLGVIFLLCSCNSARRIQEGQTLYLGSKLIIKKKKTEEKFEIKDFGKKTADAYIAIWDLPNGALFGTPFFRFLPMRLYTYNFYYTKKTKGFRYWMQENFGEEPVLIEDINPEVKIKNLIEKYESYGHFRTTGSYAIKYKKKGKAGFINYSLEVAPAYTFRNIRFELAKNQTQLSEIIEQHKKKSILRPGMEYNLDSILTEKNKLTTFLHNNGYFYINNDDIIIEADSTVGKLQVDLKISIDNNLSTVQLNTVTIDTILIEIDSVVQNRNQKYFHFDEGKLNQGFIDSLIMFKSPQIYPSRQVNQTVNLMSSLGIFRNAYVEHFAIPGDSSKIKSVIKLYPANATNISTMLNGNYKATGYIGPSLNFNLNQYNLFGKAENLNLSTDAYYDFPVGINKSKVSQSTGFTIRTLVKSPLPIKRRKFYKKGTLPFNLYSINTEFNRRIDYFNLYSLNLLYGISWQSKQNIRHRIDILNITYSSIYNTTPLFDSILKKDPFLRNSMVNQLIVGSHYVFVYDKRKKFGHPTGFYYQSEIELAGNIANLLGTTSNIKNKEIKTLFNVPIAQYIQFNYDLRYSFHTGKFGIIALRHVGGIGIPYGNNERMPYIKQYFLGGTSSLRPFSPRTIGPGRYVEPDRGEVNQVGDVKLEANLEFRFKMGVRLNGALWSDAGNIWLFNEEPSRPGSGIRWNKIIQDSYLTSGVGLRLDLNYIVLRYDFGTLIYTPVAPSGQRWVWKTDSYKFGSVIGIGYPF